MWVRRRKLFWTERNQKCSPRGERSEDPVLLITGEARTFQNRSKFLLDTKRISKIAISFLKDFHVNWDFDIFIEIEIGSRRILVNVITTVTDMNGDFEPQRPEHHQHELQPQYQQTDLILKPNHWKQTCENAGKKTGTPFQ